MKRAVSSDALAHFNKGVALQNQGEYMKAIKCYSSAIKLNPQYADAWIKKADAFSALDKPDEAIEAYNKAIEIDPQDSYSWFKKGSALSALNKYDEALLAYDKTIEIDPQYEGNLGNKSQCSVET